MPRTDPDPDRPYYAVALKGDFPIVDRLTQAEYDQLYRHYLVVPCQECGGTFEFDINRRRRTLVVCSQECRDLVYRRRRREDRAAAIAGGFTCVWCGTRFSTGRKDARTCSSRCRQAVARDRRRGGLGQRFMTTGEVVT